VEGLRKGFLPRHELRCRSSAVILLRIVHDSVSLHQVLEHHLEHHYRRLQGILFKRPFLLFKGSNGLMVISLFRGGACRSQWWIPTVWWHAASVEVAL
jgi:hypothetical protein